MGCRKIRRPSEKITWRLKTYSGNGSVMNSRRMHGFMGGVAVRKDAELEFAFWIQQRVFAKVEFYRSMDWRGKIEGKTTSLGARILRLLQLPNGSSMLDIGTCFSFRFTLLRIKLSWTTTYISTTVITSGCQEIPTDIHPINPIDMPLPHICTLLSEEPVTTH